MTGTLYDRYRGDKWGILRRSTAGRYRSRRDRDLSFVIAPPPPAVRAGGAGGLVLPEETAAHASETLAYSGICVRDVITRLGKAPSKASSPLAHQFCVFLSSSSARCCPAVPEPLLEPSTWPGAVIIGVRALALAPYLEPRGVYFILVLSSRARRPRTTREVRASHPAPALACA